MFYFIVFAKFGFSKVGRALLSPHFNITDSWPGKVKNDMCHGEAKYISSDNKMRLSSFTVWLRFDLLLDLIKVYCIVSWHNDSF